VPAVNATMPWVYGAAALVGGLLVIVIGALIGRGSERAERRRQAEFFARTPRGHAALTGHRVRLVASMPPACEEPGCGWRPLVEDLEAVQMPGDRW